MKRTEKDLTSIDSVYYLCISTSSLHHIWEKMQTYKNKKRIPDAQRNQIPISKVRKLI